MTKAKIKQLRNKTFLFIILIIAIIGGMRTYDDVQRNSQILENKIFHIEQEILYNYNQQIEQIKSFMELYGTLLSNSKEVKYFLNQNDRDGLYQSLEKKFKTLHAGNNKVNIIHFHKPNHHSFLRVHKKEKFGDNLKDIRPMITHAINTKTKTYGYEHGKYDISQLTYRGVFPIFDGDSFLGVVEIGIDTSQLIKNIEIKIKELFQNDVKISYVVKEDTPNFKKYEKTFKTINGFVYEPSVLVDSIMEKISLVEEQQVKIEDRIYSFKISNVHLLDYKNRDIGDYFYILDITQDIKDNQFFFYSSLAKPIIATIVIILLIGWIFYYFYKNFLKLEKRTRSILDGQSSLIVLSDGENLLDCNLALLEFYGYETLDGFRSKHGCICNTFEKGESFLQKNNNDIFWVDYLLEHNDDVIKVSLKDKDGVFHIFKIVLNQYEKASDFDDEYYVITLTNISSLERANAQLIEQSKQASLGEMIGNIAHQWRQPLSAIATIASSVSINNEIGKLSDQQLDESMDKIVNKTNYLSETIDTFRNFIKEEKIESSVILQERVKTALNIVSATLNSNHIQLINNFTSTNPIELKLILGELTQVIINIVNNAKDAIIENNISNGFIKVDIVESELNIQIIIEDNGGGVPKKLLDKIFEPYFTTKHQSLGTGLGLYMSYKIVTESMNGKLLVENTNDGAKFVILLPKTV